MERLGVGDSEGESGKRSLELSAEPIGNRIVFRQPQDNLFRVREQRLLSNLGDHFSACAAGDNVGWGYVFQPRCERGELEATGVSFLFGLADEFVELSRLARELELLSQLQHEWQVRRSALAEFDAIEVGSVDTAAFSKPGNTELQLLSAGADQRSKAGRELACFP